MLLTGPAGSGKTATLKTLCNDLGIAIQEWETPNEVAEFQARSNPDDLDFDDGYIRDDKVTFVSQAKIFKDFMRRAHRYKVKLTKLKYFEN